MRHWRENSVLVLVVVFSAVIVYRLIFIQILNHEYWNALAHGQQRFFVSLEGERGDIFFQDKKNLAVNKIFNLIYVSPNEIKDKESVADTLGPMFNLDKNSILEKLKKDSLYEIIKRKLNQEEMARLEELNLPGIYLGQETGRYYPFEILASRTVGFLGGDGKGQYGIEGYYDDILKGKEGVLEKEKGPGGYLISNNELADSEGGQDTSAGLSTKGSDLILTLDYNIQFIAEKLLEKAKQDLDIVQGEIIVVDPNSGKILALANFPNFNSNQYAAVKDLEIFKNLSIQEVFEPGSVFKLITMASALDQGKITPQTTYTDEGSVKIGQDTISNYDKRVWGQKTMTEVLEKSINTGAVFAERQVGNGIFQEYIKRFGIFEPTNIDLQGEVFSQNKKFNIGYEINLATAAFGQGIEMTSMQLVRALSAVANGGKLLRPYIVDKIIDNGKITETQPQVQNSSVISKNTASQLTIMMVSVVENGFAKAAKIPGYYIAGKTGTAQIPWSVLGISKQGYSEETIQSFIGFAPALDPKFLILVKLNQPKANTAEYSAAPIFKELAKYIIDYWQIPPDYE